MVAVLIKARRRTRRPQAAGITVGDVRPHTRLSEVEQHAAHAKAAMERAQGEVELAEMAMEQAAAKGEHTGAGDLEALRGEAAQLREQMQAAGAREDFGEAQRLKTQLEAVQASVRASKRRLKHTVAVQQAEQELVAAERAAAAAAAADAGGGKLPLPLEALTSADGGKMVAPTAQPSDVTVQLEPLSSLSAARSGTAMEGGSASTRCRLHRERGRASLCRRRNRVAPIQKRGAGHTL